MQGYSSKKEKNIYIVPGLVWINALYLEPKYTAGYIV